MSFSREAALTLHLFSYDFNYYLSPAFGGKGEEGSFGGVHSFKINCTLKLNDL